MAARRSTTIYGEGFSQKALDLVLLTLVGLLIFWIFKNQIVGIFESIQKNKADRLQDTIGTGTNPGADAASRLRNAMNPSGVATMRDIDGTDEAAIFAIATTITDFAQVQRDYRTIYGSSLTEDLSRELSATEYQKFLTLVQASEKVNGASPNSANQPTETPTTLPPVSQVFTLEDRQTAAAIRKCFNPSNNRLMIDFDGTDEDTLYLIAAKITNYNAVKAAYQEIYKEDLDLRLKSELDSTELQKFNTLVKLASTNKGNTNESPSPYDKAKFPAGTKLNTIPSTSTSNVNVRSESNINSVIGKVKFGQSVGTAVQTLYAASASTPGRYVLLEGIPGVGRGYIYEEYLIKA